MNDVQLVIKQTQFLSTVFLCSEFKSEKIILLLSKFLQEKKFAVIFICGNLFLQIAGKTAKITKIKTHETLVPHSRFYFCRGLRVFFLCPMLVPSTVDHTISQT